MSRSTRSSLFEDYLNKKYKTGNLKIHVALVPVRRDDIAAALLEGRGDIAAANVTVTPERLQKVDFSNPTLKNVSEIVVGGPASQPISTRRRSVRESEVFVRKGSIYNESLDKLERRSREPRQAARAGSGSPRNRSRTKTCSR